MNPAKTNEEVYKIMNFISPNGQVGAYLNYHNTPIGYAEGNLVKGDGQFFNSYWRITRVEVDEWHRRLGMGRRLISTCVKLIRSRSHYMIYAEATSKNTCRFLTKCGFQERPEVPYLFQYTKWGMEIIQMIRKGFLGRQAFGGMLDTHQTGYYFLVGPAEQLPAATEPYIIEYSNSKGIKQQLKVTRIFGSYFNFDGTVWHMAHFEHPSEVITHEFSRHVTNPGE